MELVIEVKDSDAPFLVELLNRFDFVTIKKSNQSILEGLELSLQQMKAMRDGKLSKPSIAELFEDGE